MTVNTFLRDFGAPAPEGTPEYERARSRYRQLARQYHPDRGSDGETILLLNKAWELYRKQAAFGRDPLFSVEIRKIGYVAQSPLANGDASQLFKGISTDGTAVVLKLMNDPKDSDLLKIQHETLTKLKAANPLPPVPYMLPQPLAMGTVKGRGLMVMEAYSVDLVPLRTMLEAWPEGLDIRDVLWMWRKGLTLLTFLQTQGVVHGSLNPDHLLFDLDNHGLHVVGWTSAVKSGEKLKIRDRNWAVHSAPEALAGGPVTFASDLFELTAHMSKLLGDKQHEAHPRFLSAMKASLHPEPRPRPYAGWLYDHLGELINQIHGGRKFRLLALPERKV